MLPHLPHQHCAVFLAAHTWYSADQTPTLQAFLYNQEADDASFFLVGNNILDNVIHLL